MLDQNIVILDQVASGSSQNGFQKPNENAVLRMECGNNVPRKSFRKTLTEDSRLIVLISNCAHSSFTLAWACAQAQEELEMSTIGNERNWKGVLCIFPVPAHN